MYYTKKPITIQAIKFLGTWQSIAEISGRFPDLIQDGIFIEEDKETVPWFGIKTLEGTMRCTTGDYVIKGIKGEFYPCKPDIFESSYNPKNEEGENDVLALYPDNSNPDDYNYPNCAVTELQRKAYLLGLINKQS